MPIAVEFVSTRRKKIAVDVVPAEWQTYIAHESVYNTTEISPRDFIPLNMKPPQGTGVVFGCLRGDYCALGSAMPACLKAGCRTSVSSAVASPQIGLAPSVPV